MVKRRPPDGPFLTMSKYDVTRVKSGEVLRAEAPDFGMSKLSRPKAPHATPHCQIFAVK